MAQRRALGRSCQCWSRRCSRASSNTAHGCWRNRPRAQSKTLSEASSRAASCSAMPRSPRVCRACRRTLSAGEARAWRTMASACGSCSSLTNPSSPSHWRLLPGAGCCKRASSTARGSSPWRGAAQWARQRKAPEGSSRACARYSRQSARRDSSSRRALTRTLAPQLRITSSSKGSACSSGSSAQASTAICRTLTSGWRRAMASSAGRSSTPLSNSSKTKRAALPRQVPKAPCTWSRTWASCNTALARSRVAPWSARCLPARASSGARVCNSSPACSGTQ